MTRFRFLIFVCTIFFFLSTLNVYAEPLSGSISENKKQLEEQEWKSIQKMKKVYEAAVSSGKIDSLEPLLSKDFSGVMLTGVEVQNFQDLKKYNQEIWELIGKGGEYEVEISYEPGAMLGSLAFAKGITKDLVKTSVGKNFKFQSKWSAIFAKENGKWKIYRLHASMDPIDNVFVESFLNAAKIFWAIIGFIVGVLISLLLVVLYVKFSK